MRRTASLTGVLCLAAAASLLVGGCSLLGQGTSASASKKVSYALGFVPQQMAVCDVESDGKKELVTLHSEPETLVLRVFRVRDGALRELSASRFRVRVPRGPGARVSPNLRRRGGIAWVNQHYLQLQRFSAGDVDGDPLLDLALDGTATIYEWDGRGFALHSSAKQLAKELGIKVFGDRLLFGMGNRSRGPVIVVLANPSMLGGYGETRVFSFRGGIIKRIATYDKMIMDPVAPADANNDNTIELVGSWADQQGNELVLFDWSRRKDGRYELPGSLLSVGDLDSDGHTELLLLLPPQLPFRRSQTPAVGRLQRGQLEVRSVQGIEQAVTDDTCVTVGDVDNDGRTELLTVDPSGRGRIQVYTVRR